MQSLPFTLRQLQYAVAVADTGGFGRAATLCAVSQPSLSAQVAKLEALLDVQLFERQPRGVHLTPAARELLPALRALLGQADQLQRRAQALADPAAVTLRVGVIPTVAPYLLGPVVTAMGADPLRVHWLELQTADAEAALAAGELDAVVLADPPAPGAVEDRVIGWEPFVLLVPQDHAASGPVRLDTLAPGELLLLEQGHCLRDHTRSLCRLPGALASPYRATSLPTVVQMVAQGLGVTVLPAMAVPHEGQRPGLRTLPLAGRRAGRTLRIAWRSGTAHRAQLEALAGHLERGFAASAR